jgi:hypothetical protein
MANDDSLRWGTVLGLLLAVVPGGSCNIVVEPTGSDEDNEGEGCTDDLPPGDPCRGKADCEQVPVDTGEGEVEMRFCGCCNG